MKPKSLTSSFFLLLLAAFTAVGQGTFNFSNRVPSQGIDAPVFHLDGTRLAGPEYLAQLYVGARDASRRELRRAGRAVSFGTGNSAGYWGVDEDLTRTVDWVGAGKKSKVEVRVWHIAGGKTYEEVVRSGRDDVYAGFSDTLTISAGSPGSPAYLRDLEGFFVRPASSIPEASAVKLSLLAFAVIALFRRLSPRLSSPLPKGRGSR